MNVRVKIRSIFALERDKEAVTAHISGEVSLSEELSANEKLVSNVIGADLHQIIPVKQVSLSLSGQTDGSSSRSKSVGAASHAFKNGHDLQQGPNTLFRVKIGGGPVALE